MFRSVIAGASAVLLVGPALACNSISSATIQLSACIDPLWKADAATGEQEFNYHTDDGHFALVLVTEKPSFPIAQFREAILGNALNSVDGKQGQVKVVGERVENIDNKPFNVLEYMLANKGDPILFQNYYYSQPGIGSLQILIMSGVDDATGAAFRVGQLADTVKLGDD